MSSSERAPETGDRSALDRLSALVARSTPSVVRRRYAVKFAIAVVAVIVVIGSVGALTYASTKETVEHDTRADMKSSAKLQADTVGQWIEKMRLETDALATEPGLQSGEGMQEVAEHAVEHGLDDLKAVHVVNGSTGTVVASSAEYWRGSAIDSLEVPWTERLASGHLNGTVMIERSYLSPALHDHRVLAFLAPVAGTDRTVVVVGGLYHHLERIHQPGQGQQSWLLSDTGEPVLSSENSVAPPPGPTGAHVTALSGESLHDGEEGDGHEPDGDGHGDDGTDGGDDHGDTGGHTHAGNVTFHQDEGHLLAYTRVSGTDLYVVTSAPTGSAYAVRDTVASNLLALLVAALLSLGLVGAVLWRQTVAPLADLRAKAAAMEDGDLAVDLGTDRVDEFGRLYASFAAMRDSLRERIQEAWDAREEAEQARERTERLNQHLEHKAEAFRREMQAAADGDLTRRLDPSSDHEAMASIAHEFNAMMSDLQAMVSRVGAFATEVADSSEAVTAGAEEVREASAQVSESIAEISEGADRQDRTLQQIAAEMEDLSTTIEEIASTATQVAERADRTATLGDSGREAAENAIEGMDDVDDSVDEVVEAIGRLQSEVAEVEDLVSTITDIAGETNMLALNANIEASRAAAGQDGFTAVAAEVKELSQQAQQAAEDAETRLERITEETDRTVAEVRNAREQVDRGSEAVTKAADALDRIADVAAETNHGVQEISGATQQQASATQEVVAMVDDVTAIAEETTAESETVAAAAQEQTSALTQVAEHVQGLAGRAERLDEALDRFEVGEDGRDGPVLSFDAEPVGEDPTDLQWIDNGDPTDHGD